MKQEHVNQQELSKEEQAKEALIARAMQALEQFIYQLAKRAEESQDYAEDLWKRITVSPGAFMQPGKIRGFEPSIRCAFSRS